MGNNRQALAEILTDDLIRDVTNVLFARARRLTGRSSEWVDMVQKGWHDAIVGIAWYDSERASLKTWLVNRGIGGMQHYLRDRSELIKRPAWVQEETTRLLRCKERLERTLQHEPSSADLASELGWSVKYVEWLLEVRTRSHDIAAFDGFTDVDSPNPFAQDKVAAPVAEPTRDWDIDRLWLRGCIERLKPLEKQALSLFVFQDMTQTEISYELGYSVTYVSHLIRGAMAKIRRWKDAADREEQALFSEPPRRIVVQPPPLSDREYRLSVRG